MNRPPAQDHPEGQTLELILRLNGFTREALTEESNRLGIPADDLAVFAILYYLADIDSRRIARRISMAPHPAAATPSRDCQEWDLGSRE